MVLLVTGNICATGLMFHYNLAQSESIPSCSHFRARVTGQSQFAI